MKQIIGCFILGLLVLLAGCSTTESVQSEVIQPTATVIHFINAKNVIKDEEKVSTLSSILEGVTWKQIEVTWSRNPDVEFYLLPPGVDAKETNSYQVWINENGAELYQTGKKLYGKIPLNDATFILELFKEVSKGE